MTNEEHDRIAEYLGLSPATFRKRYGVRRDRETSMWAIETVEGRGCTLLTDERQCSVHSVKPLQCSSYPFWPEMISDRKEWEEAKSFCPGLDRRGGRLYSEEEILEIVTRVESADAQKKPL